MEGQTKAATINQKSTFSLFLCFFFLKVQDIRKAKTPNFERRSHNYLGGQVLTIFQTSPSVEPKLRFWQGRGGGCVNPLKRKIRDENIFFSCYIKV